MSDLKPCPFCGCIKIKDSKSGPTGHVMCMNCFSSSSKERWNTRHTPEGYALVPVEPTELQIKKGFDAMNGYGDFKGGRKNHIGIYKAMIAAAQGDDK